MARTRKQQAEDVFRDGLVRQPLPVLVHGRHHHAQLARHLFPLGERRARRRDVVQENVDQFVLHRDGAAVFGKGQRDLRPREQARAPHVKHLVEPAELGGRVRLAHHDLCFFFGCLGCLFIG